MAESPEHKPTVRKEPAEDSKWSDDQWNKLIQELVDQGIVTPKEVAVAVLGHINPPQVGTSIASSDSIKYGFKNHWYSNGKPPRSFWQGVRSWLYQQNGTCADCATRMDLQADHIESRIQYGLAADRLDNMTLRCRRHNVVRRESHKQGGITFLTTEAALMWILLVKRPDKYSSFKVLCREYGLTMADIRFQEAWAMARWLERIGKYQIAPESEL
jgi:hypothetical protein